MWRNQIKTAILLGILSGFTIFLGKLLSGTQGIYSGIIFAGLLSAFSYFFSSSMVLAIHRARPMNENEHPEIFNIIRDLAHEMKLPMPQVFNIPTKVANAFATGRNPSHSVIGITDGILRLLDIRELRGVLAHELSHIRHRDTLLMAVASTLAVSIGYLANVARQLLLFLAYRRDRRNRDETGVHPFALLLIVTVMPIAAALVRLAISRNREYQADEAGALATKDPLALASALEKMHEYKKVAHFPLFDMARATTAPLFIINPLWGRGLATLFSTHPPVEERIRRLRILNEKLQ